MGSRRSRDRVVTGRVIVIARNDADTIVDCLDALAPEIASEGLQVVVVDQNSSDETAELAIHHPVPDRVMVVADGSLQRVVNAGSKEARHVLLLRADVRPAPGWAAAAMAGLSCAPIVVGPDADCRNLALDIARTRYVDLLHPGEDMDEMVRRARHAGLPVGTAAGMAVSPAERRTVEPGPLPAHEAPERGTGFRGSVSVVLCTRDRPVQLERCLASLARLDDDDHRIIVVDNHAEPTVDPRALPPRARLVHEPGPGLDVARNRGLSEADDGIVAYIDDDCEADPHWLTALRVAFADPDVGMVTGRVRPASLRAPTHRYFESQFGFDRGFVRRRFTAWDDRPWFPLWTGPMGTGCNMAFRRDVLLAVDGFDELLDVGSTIGGGGDLDVFARLVDQRVTAEYAPDALVWHHHRDDLRELRRQFHGYGEASGAYLTKAVLDRRGLRLTAVRFYFTMLANCGRTMRDVRAGRRIEPLPLLVTYILGQLSGPPKYLRARWSARGEVARR